MMAFGMDRAMTPLDELVDADVIVVVGANLSDAYPVMLPTTINKARQRGARVVAIDPRFGRWVQDDDLQIAIRPGTDGALFVGLLAEIEAQGLIDIDFMQARTSGFDDAIAGRAASGVPSASKRSPTSPAATVRELARLIGTAERCMILHARGPEQQTMGTNNVLAMINVALACGHIGKPSCGINMLTGQRNGQGGREWGQRCNQLPAGRSISRSRAPCGRRRAVGRRRRLAPRCRRHVRRDPPDGGPRRDQGPAVDLEQHERLGTGSRPGRRADGDARTLSS